MVLDLYYLSVPLYILFLIVLRTHPMLVYPRTRYPWSTPRMYMSVHRYYPYYVYPLDLYRPQLSIPRDLSYHDP